jgi:HEAT repeat protein
VIPPDRAHGRLWALAVSVLFVVAPGLGAAPSAPPLSDAGPALEALSTQVKDASRPEAERIQLIEVLGQWEAAQVRAPLLAVLADPLVSIRAAAARALGWRGNVDAVAALRARFEAPGEASAVRAAALEALGQIGDDSTRALLVSETRNPDAKVREAALRGVTVGPLARQADQVAFLRQTAADVDLDLLLRCQAIQGLGALQDTGAVELLTRLLEQGPPFPMPRLSYSLTQSEIMSIRYREVRNVKAWSARALGVLDARSALSVLLKTAEDRDDYFLRLMSLETLRAWKASEAVPVMVRRLRDRFDPARIVALQGLADIGDRSVVDAVLTRLYDREPKVRAQAVKTLASLGDPKARPQLEIAQQRDLDPDVQRALAEALAQLSR